MDYLRIPRTITCDEILGHGQSWAPSMYRRVEIPTRKTTPMRDLLSGWWNGKEVGSLAYVRQSPYKFIRTKAIQPNSSLSQFNGGSVAFVTPSAYHKAVDESPGRMVADGDIIYNRAGNVGEVAIVEGCGKAMPSGHMMRITFKENKWYIFAFMKHDICRAQQRTQQAGAIKALDNFKIDQLLDCRVPFPDQPDAGKVERYVAALMESIVEKERAIRSRHQAILAAVEAELDNNSGTGTFSYEHPSSTSVQTAGRFDTGLYCEGFRRFKHRVDNYTHGSKMLSQMGVKSRRGPNLAVSVIGRSLYSEIPKSNWYELIRPVNISEYGTLTRREWLGNRRSLTTVNRGDIVFGCEGFGKGRSIVLIDVPDRTTTNYHGTAISWPGASLEDVVWLRCYFAYMREKGVLDWVGVGGSGGHMSPEYFDSLPIPSFSVSARTSIAQLYHTPDKVTASPLSISDFVGCHQRSNKELGIWQLNTEMKALQNELAEAQSRIIKGEVVEVPFPEVQIAGRKET